MTLSIGITNPDELGYYEAEIVKNPSKLLWMIYICYGILVFYNYFALVKILRENKYDNPVKSNCNKMFEIDITELLTPTTKK